VLDERRGGHRSLAEQGLGCVEVPLMLEDEREVAVAPLWRGSGWSAAQEPPAEVRRGGGRTAPASGNRLPGELTTSRRMRSGIIGLVAIGRLVIDRRRWSRIPILTSFPQGTFPPKRAERTSSLAGPHFAGRSRPLSPPSILIGHDPRA